MGKISRQVCCKSENEQLKSELSKEHENCCGSQAIVDLFEIWGLNKWFWVLLLSDYYLKQGVYPDSFCCLPKAAGRIASTALREWASQDRTFQGSKRWDRATDMHWLALTCWCFDCLMRIMLCKRAFSQGKGSDWRSACARAPRTSNSKLSCPRHSGHIFLCYL